MSQQYQRHGGYLTPGSLQIRNEQEIEGPKQWTGKQPSKGINAATEAVKTNGA